MSKVITGLFFFVLSVLSVFGFGSIGLPVFSVVSFVAINSLSVLLITSKSGKKLTKRKDYLEQQVKVYFSSHDHFQISEHVIVRAPKVGYKNYEELDVYYQDDLVCKFHEFDQYFPETYQLLLKKLEKDAIVIQEVPKEVVPESQVEEIVKEETSELNVIRSFIEQLDEYNVDIMDETLSSGLYNTTARLKQLILLQEKYPKSNRKLVKLTSHYLPILIEILKNYCTVRNTHANQDEIVAMEEKLNKTIILINEAIKNITSSLFQEEMMNLSADMTVLENILKNDGLINDEMNMEQLNKMVH